ncbi:hypothetical protein, partial [uncultured Anaerotruncus sp.]|uniref:hypothetical protein n=1 Tax=uncultured Anaerotruncus sp. TaxID=905011 RepID=UPI002585D9E1
MPLAAAKIAGSRPGGGFGFAALRPAGLDRNCRLKSGKNHERVPPRTTGSFSDGRKGTKSPP